ncbi:MAG: hypothetical protein ACXU95_13975 [Isosphaeraceae bacterium]
MTERLAARRKSLRLRCTGLMGTISFTMTTVLAVNAGSSSLKYALFGPNGRVIRTDEESEIARSRREVLKS